MHTRVLVERPSRWSPAQQVAILELVERALYEGKNAALLCEQVGMPPAGLVRKWAAELAGWAERLEAAEDAYFDHLADETINIGDKAIADPDCLRKARQRQQSRQWLIERRRRRKYGRQVDLTTDGRALSPVALLPPELLLKESA